jgi:hypothetical protein
MRRPRFTIASLLVFVLFLAFGLAALRESTEVWDVAVFGVTFLLLLTSVLLAVHRTGPRRAYWLGFALFGGAYLAAGLIPPVGARLPTSKGLVYLDSLVPGRQATFTIAFSPQGGIGTKIGTMQVFAATTTSAPVATPSPATSQIWNVTTGRLLFNGSGTSENFLKIGHSLAALMIAFLGAHLSRYLRASGKSEAAVSEASPSRPIENPEAGATP